MSELDELKKQEDEIQMRIKRKREMQNKMKETMKGISLMREQEVIEVAKTNKKPMM